MEEHVQRCEDALCGTQEGKAEDLWGPPPAPLSQTVADIVDLYNAAPLWGSLEV